MAKAFHLPIWEGEGSHPGTLARGFVNLSFN